MHPPPLTELVTVRQAIGYLYSPEQHTIRRRRELIDAWNKCPPGKSLRKAVPNVSSFESVKLHADRSSTTQTANHFNWHYAIPRYLTIEEMALVGSFAPAFTWPSKQEKTKRQIGNSVPPLFMRAIAHQIRARLATYPGQGRNPTVARHPIAEDKPMDPGRPARGDDLQN